VDASYDEIRIFNFRLFMATAAVVFNTILLVVVQNVPSPSQTKTFTHSMLPTRVVTKSAANLPVWKYSSRAQSALIV